MGATFSRIKTWASNDTLTAADLNAEFNNILNNLDPNGVDDASANATAMQALADPYPGGSPSLATNLTGELQRIRYVIQQITGEANWYIDPDNSLINTGSPTYANVTTTTAVLTNTISERTAASGVTIDGVLCKDNNVTVGTSGQVVTDTIAEKTSTAGVTIDGCLVKDGVANKANYLELISEGSATHATSASVSFTGLTVGDRVHVEFGADVSLAGGAPNFAVITCAQTAGTSVGNFLNSYTTAALMINNGVAAVFAGKPITSGTWQITTAGDGALTLNVSYATGGTGATVNTVQIYAYKLKDA